MTRFLRNDSVDLTCNLPRNSLRRVEQIDLRVQLGAASTRFSFGFDTTALPAHLAPGESGHHRIHEMPALAELQLRQLLLRENEDLSAKQFLQIFCASQSHDTTVPLSPLIDASKLAIDLEMLLVERLQQRVQQAREQRRGHLERSTSQTGQSIYRIPA